MRACSRPMMITVLLMILSRDTTMSWMCLKVFPWKNQKGEVSDGQALLNFVKWKQSADIIASGFHSARCRAVVLDSQRLSSFLESMGRMGKSVTWCYSCFRPQVIKIGEYWQNFIVRFYDVFTIEWILQWPGLKESTKGLESAAILCSRAVKHSVQF